MKNYGIIGYPLGHSFSPTIHNLAFKHYRIDADYGKMEIEESRFDEKIQELKESGWLGFNVTIPYKQQILPYLDKLDPICSGIGAVNTVLVNKDQSWIGYNTDYIGFIKPIKASLDQIRSCLIIGAGGAAQAVGFGLLEFSKINRLVIVNRTQIKSVALLDKLNSFKPIDGEISDPSNIHRISEKFDLIVNTTSVGMGKLKDKSPLSIKHIVHSGTIAYDLIYNPAKTIFLKEAEELGMNYINGLPMLIGQAEESFRIWTGKGFNATINEQITALLS